MKSKVDIPNRAGKMLVPFDDALLIMFIMKVVS